MLVAGLIAYLQSKNKNEKVFVLSGKYDVKELEEEDCIEFKNTRLSEFTIFLYVIP